MSASVPKIIAFKPIQTANKIVVGTKMSELIEKSREKFLVKQLQLKDTKSKPLLISCPNPEFNHYLNQKYANFDHKMLYSAGWTKRRSNGKYFTVNPVAKKSEMRLNDDEEQREQLDGQESAVYTNPAEKLRVPFPQKFLRVSNENRLKMMLDLCETEKKKSEKSTRPRNLMIFSHRSNVCMFVDRKSVV